MSNRTLTVVLAIIASALAGALISRAGPLDPPAGPVAPTYKTLTEVEPRTAINATNTPGDADSLYKITKAGSYYLTGNIAGVAGRHGIEIAAHNVTIDLMGFTLQGVAGSLDGIRTDPSALVRGACVRNGFIVAFGEDGIDFTANTDAGSSLIEGIQANGNTWSGIHTGPSGVIRNCVTMANGSSGVSAGVNAVIEGCASSLNNVDGFEAGFGSVIANSSAASNGGNGFFGDSGSSINNCAAEDNRASGFVLEPGGTITASSSKDNHLHGIKVNSGCAVRDCVVRFNYLDGINCPNSCVIDHNTCSINGSSGNGAGIHVTGVDNRIERNNCITADRGIVVEAAGNIIIRNTCSGNTTNWDVVAGNTILVVQGTSAGAVLGNTGGLAPGSTDPNANFTY